MAAGGVAEDVARGEGSGWEVELAGEHAEDLHAEAVGVVGEGLQQVPGFRVFEVRRVAARGGEVVQVVCVDVEEFDGVGTEGGVGFFDDAGGFVARHALAFD